MSSKLNVRDRIEMVKDFGGAKQGMRGVIIYVSDFYYGIRFDEKNSRDFHNCDGKCEGDRGYFVTHESVKLIPKEPKFLAGQIYKVGTFGWGDNAVIKITEVKGERAKYKMLKGEHKYNTGFDFDSIFGKSLTLLTGKAIGEALREDKPATTVKEVKRQAKVDEYIKIINPWYNKHITENDYVAGSVLKVRKIESSCTLLVDGMNDDQVVSNVEYVVLENYKPKAKVGDTIKVLEDNGGKVKSGTIWTVTKVLNGGNLSVTHESDEFTWVVRFDNYVVISSKHAWTAAEVERAKKFVLDTIREQAEKVSYVLFNKSADSKEVTAFVTDLDTHLGTVPYDEDLHVRGFATGKAKCSPTDEPNIWIGKAVALCKLLHKDIPSWIMEG